MRSREYWRKREEEHLKGNLKTEAEYTKEINGYYDYMMDQVQKEINGFYAKYAKKEGITLAEAKKRVSKLDIEEYGRKAAKYVKEKDFSERANEEMRLYNATMKINRLEMLKANIGLELVSGFDDLQKYYDQILTDRTLEEFERQAGILGKTIQNNAKAAGAIVNSSFHNATFSDRIWMYQDMLKAELSKLLQEGMIQGRNPRQLARHITKRFGAVKSDAERLMRTELARVQTEAQKQSFERNGFSQYEFIALGSACPICKEIDGKHFDAKKMLYGMNAPPMHPNCRCSVAAYEDDKDYEDWLDFLDKGGTTEEWKKSKIIGEKEKSKTKYKYGHTAVNKKEIDSSNYRKRIDKISDNADVNRSIWNCAKEILNHRTGTKYEDLVFVDSTTGKFALNKDYNVENRAKPNKPMNKMLSELEPHTIIAIHNHPGSSAPSISDIMVCVQRKYKYGVVVCHDGKIYKYSVDKEKFNKMNASFALDRIEKKGYTDDTIKLLGDAGVRLEAL